MEAKKVMGFQFQPKRNTENIPASPASLDVDRDETGSDEEIASEKGLRSERNDWCKCGCCCVMTAYGFLDEKECIC